MRNCLFYILLLVGAVLSSRVNAQVQDPNSPTYDLNYTDSTQTDSSASEGTATDSSAKENIDPALRPYQRMVLTMDSVTNLITYSGVVEQEESGSDSLYTRAKRFANKYLGKGNIFELDKRNQKLIIAGTVPAYSYPNKYSKRPIGHYEFKMTVLIKEGRYKYTINNLLHEAVKPQAGGKPQRNYFEYYYTTNNNVQLADRILRYADRDLNELIERFKVAMREPKLQDEDDW